MTFRRMYDSIPVTPSVSGEKIYSYEYVNKDGKTCIAERDTYQMIQSSKAVVDYKRSIAEYGLDDNPELHSRNGIYADVSELGNDYTDIIGRLEATFQAIRGDIDTLCARKVATEPSKEGGQVEASASEENK